MNTALECFACFVRQTVLALGHYDADDEQKSLIIKDICDSLHGVDIKKTPAYATTFMFRRIKELTGIDPYAGIKRQYNESALRLYPDMRNRVLLAPDPLWSACRMAIAGNIIDFGIFHTVDVEGTVERALRKTIEVDHIDEFVAVLAGVSEVLYLLDNAGEMVFDMLLIEVLQSMGKTVTAVVKGGPVINDVTIEDVRQAGLESLCRVIDNGTDAVGTELALCSREFVREFEGHSLIVSKGQGNFETLESNVDKDIFFLFQAKCDVIARHLGLSLGAMLLKYNKHKEAI